MAQPQQPQITPADQYADQYREVAASRRNHDLMMWQTLAVAVVVDGTVLAIIFDSLDTSDYTSIPWSKLLVVGLALGFTLLLIYALAAHRHWAEKEKLALEAIEAAAQLPRRVHWGGKPHNGLHYWTGSPAAPWWYRWSAFAVYQFALCVVAGILFAMLVGIPLSVKLGLMGVIPSVMFGIVVAAVLLTIFDP